MQQNEGLRIKSQLASHMAGCHGIFWQVAACAGLILVYQMPSVLICLTLANLIPVCLSDRSQFDTLTVPMQYAQDMDANADWLHGHQGNMNIAASEGGMELAARWSAFFAQQRSQIPLHKIIQVGDLCCQPHHLQATAASITP